jgi:hypothetical protein
LDEAFAHGNLIWQGKVTKQFLKESDLIEQKVARKGYLFVVTCLGRDGSVGASFTLQQDTPKE